MRGREGEPGRVLVVVLMVLGAPRDKVLHDE
jgi:hypothetical protein